MANEWITPEQFAQDVIDEMNKACKEYNVDIDELFRALVDEYNKKLQENKDG